MWLLGNDIKDADCKLTPVAVDDVYKAIRNGKITYSNAEVEFVQASATPFVMLCRLNSNKRSTAKFSFTEYFCISIHNFPKDKRELCKWKENLIADSRVMLAFLSSDKTLFHIIFQLRLPCKNKKQFSVFYRVFCTRFFREHDIIEEVDNMACEPTRPIALSHDPNAFMRIGSKLVIVEEYDHGHEADELHERIEKHEDRKVLKKNEKGTRGEPNARELSIVKNILNNGISRYDTEKANLFKQRQKLFDEGLKLLTDELDANGIVVREATAAGAVRKLRVAQTDKVVVFNIVYTERFFSVSTTACLTPSNLWIATAKEIIEKHLKKQLKT